MTQTLFLSLAVVFITGTAAQAWFVNPHTHNLPIRTNHFDLIRLGLQLMIISIT